MQFLSVAAVLGTVIIAGCLIAVLIELIARILVWYENKFIFEKVSRKDYIDPEYHAYLNWIENWDKPIFRYIPVGFRLFNNENSIDGKVRNNSLGFRCSEFTKREDGVLRIAVMGGSAAWGQGASSNEATIAGRLQRIVEEKGELLERYHCSRVECFNLAQVNACQTHDILTLTMYAGRIQPQIVVSFTGWNEIVTTRSKKEILQDYGIFYVEELEGWESESVAGNKIKRLKKYLRLCGDEKSTALRRFKLLRRNVRPPYSLVNIEERTRVVKDVFTENLSRLQALARAYDFQHLQVFQPNLYRKKYPTEAERKVLDLYDNVRPVHGGAEVGSYLRENEIYDTVIKDIEKRPQQCGRYIDLSDVFRDEKKAMFFTLVHLRDVGYSLIAENIVASLLSDRSETSVVSDCSGVAAI